MITYYIAESEIMYPPRGETKWRAAKGKTIQEVKKEAVESLIFNNTWAKVGYLDSTGKVVCICRYTPENFYEPGWDEFPEYCLLGKTIAELEITTDKKAIRFVMSDGTNIVAMAAGHCCSETWIENIQIPFLGFPAYVLSVEDLPITKYDEDSGVFVKIESDEVEEDKYYGFEIITNKGKLLIEYRNESNGYYGGYLSWPGDDWVVGSLGQNEINNEWVKVKSDM